MIIDQTPRLIDLGSKIFLSDTPIAADECMASDSGCIIYNYLPTRVFKGFMGPRLSVVPFVAHDFELRYIK